MANFNLVISSILASLVLLFLGIVMFGLVSLAIMPGIEVTTQQVYIISIDQIKSNKLLFQVILCDSLDCHNTKIKLNLASADIDKHNLKKAYYDKFKLNLYSIEVCLDDEDCDDVATKYYFTYLEALSNIKLENLLILGVSCITGSLLIPVFLCMYLIIYRIHKLLTNPDSPKNQKAPDQNSVELGFMPTNLLPQQTGVYYPMTQWPTNWQGMNGVYFAEPVKPKN